jgi:hypothetical protein
MNTEAFPQPTSDEIKARVLKTETIQLRLTKIEKDEIRRVASRLSLSITDYILKCHEVVAEKLPEISPDYPSTTDATTNSQ